ncbi:hypothetical protein SAPIO_CDS6348 [Scedosporium apiospermum]|uniref:Serine-type D-Ala-D-Ala carboxypeptidase n=1 Tax=Pseudallescheria apiosperma TaxID=563466 RepID=A0A084G446_PSEDA|nr:uncharacterized protein SAPIO_CDS6348 [Scedosporium apiospermum]KEZ42108.1 hypothetical protein SAPIO_CDS6348 [Scedosporium apiospermum]
MRLGQVGTACLWLAAQAGAAATNFSSRVDEILSRPTFADATVGVRVYDLETGDIVYTRNEDSPLIPASNQKLLTSAVALSKLGLDFIFDTAAFATCAVNRNGVLNGDLWLVGSGDPSLTSERLADLARDLVARTGLKRITGNVYGDGSVFDNKFLGEGWSEDDESFYYSAQVAGLNTDLNVVSVTVSPGPAEGSAATVKVNGVPADEELYVDIQSTIDTIAAGGQNSGVFERLHGTNTIILGGSISADSGPITFQITIDNPNAFTAYRFALALNRAGVQVPRSPTKPGKAPRKAVRLGTSKSEPLSSLLKLFMKPSDNMYGEALLKTVGRAEYPNQPGSSASGVQVVKAFLEQEDIDSAGVSTVDGSGLSSLNTVTARFITDLLVHNRKTFTGEEWNTYFDALPIGGVDGTLKDRFVGSPVAGHVRAKTVRQRREKLKMT